MVFQTSCNYCGFLNEHINKFGPNGITKIFSKAWCDQHIPHSQQYMPQTAQNYTVHIIPALVQTCQIFSLFSALDLWRKVKKI